MPKPRDLDRQTIAIILGLTLLIIGSVSWVVFKFLGPMPPRVVLMTTGPEGSAYHEFGLRYQTILAREGIEVRLLPSAGAVENLERLLASSSGVDFGFLQGGITSKDESPDLSSLGTMFYEPFWIFYRGLDPGKNAEGFRGRRISLGPHKSGTRHLALKILAMSGITDLTAEFLALDSQEAGEALLKGQLDVAVMVSPWSAPIVQKLLASTDVDLFSVPRADAYVALLPYLNRLTLPAGVGDLATNRPPTDIVLVAPKASLVVRNDLHPAIQHLLLQASVEIHSGLGIFHQYGKFPAPESVDLLVNTGARQYYQAGEPFLQRYLPFWIAVFVARGLLLTIPILALIYPLMRYAPGLYDWQMRRHIYKLYGELKCLEADIDVRKPGQGIEDLMARFEGLESRAHRMRVPLWYSHVLYNLRLHMNLVRDRLPDRSRHDPDDPPDHITEIAPKA
jgi:TRAP-type uncharacterized transport system substrate-binding protein